MEPIVSQYVDCCRGDYKAAVLLNQFIHEATLLIGLISVYCSGMGSFMGCLDDEGINVL